MRIHCVHMIDPLSTDKRVKPRVALKLVLAASPEEAVRKVAEHYGSLNLREYGNCLLSHRNDWSEDEVITWGHQTWERHDMDTHKARTLKEIIASKEVLP